MSVRRFRETGMALLIDQWRAEGTSAQAFAREHGVSKSTLFRWRRRLAAHGPARHAQAGTLVPVHVIAGPEPSASTMEVTLVTGDRIRIGNGVTPETLRCVVQALRTAC